MYRSRPLTKPLALADLRNHTLLLNAFFRCKVLHIPTVFRALIWALLILWAAVLLLFILCFYTGTLYLFQSLFFLTWPFSCWVLCCMFAPTLREPPCTPSTKRFWFGLILQMLLSNADYSLHEYLFLPTYQIQYAGDVSILLCLLSLRTSLFHSLDW